jgi:hypothetical protein
MQGSVQRALTILVLRQRCLFDSAPVGTLDGLAECGIRRLAEKADRSFRTAHRTKRASAGKTVLNVHPEIGCFIRSWQVCCFEICEPICTDQGRRPRFESSVPLQIGIILPWRF